jgi:hypothetical protein
MEIFLILKVFILISILIGIYAILRNLDILKIIFTYFFDKLSGK